VCLFARCWRRAIYGVVLIMVKIATAAKASHLCLFVMMFVAIDVFIAALAACLCGLLVVVVVAYVCGCRQAGLDL
jgi:hypothetical protein